MATHDDDPIWYAAYGSNCLGSRLAAYLSGARAEGATRVERGARDPGPPIRSAPYWFSSTVRFIGNSAKWGGGGVAFLDHTSDGRAPGRRHLITRGQFDDLAAQESGRSTRPLPVDELTPGTVHALGDGPYDGLLSLGRIDGLPLVTFTSPTPRHDRSPNPPSAAYLSTILRGLLEVHTCSFAELTDHVLRAPGMTPRWNAAELERLVRN